MFARYVDVVIEAPEVPNEWWYKNNIYSLVELPRELNKSIDVKLIGAGKRDGVARYKLRIAQRSYIAWAIQYRACSAFSHTKMLKRVPAGRGELIEVPEHLVDEQLGLGMTRKQSRTLVEVQQLNTSRRRSGVPTEQKQLLRYIAGLLRRGHSTEAIATHTKVKHESVVQLQHRLNAINDAVHSA